MSTWLKIGPDFIAKMKGGTNDAWEIQRFSGKTVPLPNRWLQIDAPGSIVIDPQAPIPTLAKIPPSSEVVSPEAPSGDSEYLNKGNFAYLSWDGSYYPDSDPLYWGFKKLQILRVEGGKIVKKLQVASGSPGAQSRPFVHPAKDFPGSGNPIPEGVYRVADLIKNSVSEEGVGYEKIPLDQLPTAPNDRSDLLAHNDSNRATAPGSLGCVVAVSDGDWAILKAILAGISFLIVNWDQGYLEQIKVHVGFPQTQVLAANPPIVQGDIFDKALEFTLKWEGGKVDDPNDIGGRTNRGITQKTYDAWRASKGLSHQDVYLCTLDETKRIYEQKYWEPLGTQSAALETVNFDTGVMHGTDGAIMFVQEALGLSMTGTYDQTTRAAVMKSDPRKLAEKIVQGRIAYRHERVAQSASQGVFLEGWLSRDESLEDYIKSL